jgi:predicted transposase/invertase (TIGR01784 family)
MDNAISKTQERLDFVTQDKEVLREYHLREMALMDWNSGINAATENGIEIGIEKGIVQGAMQKQIEMAKKMLIDGLPVEVIHKYTDLDVETIRSL